MDETDILEYRCKFCQKPFWSIWALNRHIKREHATPRETPILGILITGLSIAVAPAIVIGAIVTWALWDIKPHNAAVIVGLIIAIVVMWLGGWLALIVGSEEGR